MLQPLPLSYQIACPNHQSGMGATGFLLSALPILLLGLGGVELTHGLFVRQALSHALIEAGRAATVDHGHPDTLVRAFERALHPLFLQTGSLTRALAQRSIDTGQAPWQIRIVQPQRSAFADHADPDVRVNSGPPGRRTINHDYQALQHQRRLSSGWPQGRGPASGQTIFQANTLTLELIWPHEPLMPGLKALLRALSPARESYRSRLMMHGYLPILRGISLSMQSHPVDWPDRSDGKVIHGELSEIFSGPQASCTGFWSGCAPLTAQPPSGRPVSSVGQEGGDGPGHAIDSDKGSNDEPDRSSGQVSEMPDELNAETGNDNPAPACIADGCC